MRQTFVLPSQTFANGGNVQIPLRNLPAGKRVKGFLLRLEAVITCGGAAVLIPGKELYRLLQNVEIPGVSKSSGVLLHFADWLRRGAETVLAASVPATNAGVFQRIVEVPLTFVDDVAWSPNDSARESESLQDKVISIDFATFASLDTGSNNWNNLASITGTLRCVAVLDDGEAVAGSDVRVGFFDFSGQSVPLDPGLYEHLFMFKETTVGITSLEVATLDLTVDGRKVHDVMRPQELVAQYNEEHALGSDIHADSATAPVAAERLTTEPAFTAAAAATVTFEFLPIIFPGRSYKRTKLVEIINGGLLNLTGSLSTYRFGFRRIAARSEGAARQALADLGVRGEPQAKTESKAPLSPGKVRHTRYFPLRGA